MVATGRAVPERGDRGETPVPIESSATAVTHGAAVGESPARSALRPNARAG